MSTLGHGSVVVTGASRGIGLATACLLAGARVPVVLTARSRAALLRARTAMGEGGALVEVVAGDVTDEAIVSRAVAAACELAPLAALVNNAGMLEPVAPLRELDAAALRRLLDVNVVGAALGMREALTASRRADPLRIVNVSSGAAVRAIPGWTAYAASKAAMNMMTAVAAAENPDAVVTAIAPGIIETAMQRHIRTLPPAQFPAVADFVGYKEQGKLAHPVDACVAIAWLALAAPRDLNGRFVAPQDIAEALASWRSAHAATLEPAIDTARAWFQELEPDS